MIRRFFPFLLFCLTLSFSPGNAEVAKIAFFDMSDQRAVSFNDPKKLRREYDEGFVVSSLEGLVNRKSNRLFVRCDPKLDDFWWARMTENGSWLDKIPVEKITSLSALLAKFSGDYRGAVVYDEKVPATSNLAATIAGADDLVVLRYDTDPASLYQELTTGPNAIPIKVRLINADGSSMFTGQGTIPDIGQPSTGSAKNDAYRWLIEKYLKAGKLDPTELGYYVDSFWLRINPGYPQFGDNIANLDFIMARRGLVFDLDFFTDETPVDDPGQKMGADLETLKLILATCNQLTKGKTMINLHGFVPWAYKYCSSKSPTWNAGGKHDGVPGEWTSVQLFTSYNVASDCDAMSDMSNASFYQHYSLPAVIPQNPPSITKESLIKRGLLTADGKLLPINYYAYYVGDYDSAAWVYCYLPAIWSDPNRGRIPLSWNINPNLAERFPFALAWFRKTATPNDVFVAGDDGAGYINPALLSEPRTSGLPSGVGIWEERNLRYFKQWDLDTVGFVIDGFSPFMKPDAMDAYSKFAPTGLICQNEPPEATHKGMPMLKMASIGIQKAADVVQFFGKDGPHFIVVRSVLWTPTNHIDTSNQIDQMTSLPHKLVDLRTMLQLYKYSKSSP
jgi:GxGYxYP putative glycoside hydrolase C-terminal domain/GxGYxY sequence motif in domain of unknown function N-terminal